MRGRFCSWVIHIVENGGWKFFFGLQGEISSLRFFFFLPRRKKRRLDQRLTKKWTLLRDYEGKKSFMVENDVGSSIYDHFRHYSNSGGKKRKFYLKTLKNVFPCPERDWNVF